MYHVAMAPSSLALGADPHTLCALTLECLSCLCSDTWVTPLFVTLVSLTRPCPSAGVRYDLCSLPPLCRLVSLCLVLPSRALSCFAALSCPLLFSSRSCLVLSCLLVSSCRVSSYLILSYLILSYLSRTQYLRRLSGYVQKLISAFWTIATLRTCVCYHIARVDTFPVMCG